jgi:hypothetical protein
MRAKCRRQAFQLALCSRYAAVAGSEMIDFIEISTGPSPARANIPYRFAERVLSQSSISSGMFDCTDDRHKYASPHWHWLRVVGPFGLREPILQHQRRYSFQALWGAGGLR